MLAYRSDFYFLTMDETSFSNNNRIKQNFFLLVQAVSQKLTDRDPEIGNSFEIEFKSETERVVHEDNTIFIAMKRRILIGPERLLSPHPKPTAARPLFKILITDPWTRVATTGVRKIRGRRERERKRKREKERELASKGKSHYN